MLPDIYFDIVVNNLSISNSLTTGFQSFNVGMIVKAGIVNIGRYIQHFRR